MNKYTLSVRRWDSASYKFVVKAESFNDAHAIVRPIAERELPHPEEKDIIVDLVSIEVLNESSSLSEE